VVKINSRQIGEIRVKTFFPTSFIFILPESNTFLPNSVGRRALRPGAAMVKVENSQFLPACGRTGGTVLRGGGKHQETRFCKKQNFGTP
jgi:hypothetical protein